ncbi:MAG: recombination regulator RecX [Lentisphaeria bacterium]|nr:recombination regulator RecX [Lentisphaeria bacterium]
MDGRIEITRSKKRGKRIELTLSDGDSIKVLEESVFKHGLFTERSFSPEQWVEILTDAWEAEAHQRMMDLLARRPHTRKEMCRKLYKREFAPDIIDRVTKRAEELGILNDRVFADLFVDEKITVAGWGERKIRTELAKRGVEKQIIQDAFEKLDQRHGEEVVWLHACQLAEKKWKILKREDNIYKKKQKLLQYLSGRGFDAACCYKLYDHCAGRDSDSEDFLHVEEEGAEWPIF